MFHERAIDFWDHPVKTPLHVTAGLARSASADLERAMIQREEVITSANNTRDVAVIKAKENAEELEN